MTGALPRRRYLVASLLTAVLAGLFPGAPARAVSPPDAFFNPSSGGRNVALLEGGATVLSRTSSRGGCYEPASMINFPTGDCGWYSASGAKTNQSVKIALAGGGTYLVDRVKVMPIICCSLDRVQNFEIAVSTTTADDAAFTTVLGATAANSAALQQFVLPQPVFARYVRYTELNNRGGCCFVATEQLKVLTGQEGGATVTFQNLSTDPDNDIVSYLWDFGDGTPPSTEVSPTHTFPAPGTYSVSLTVTDATGATDTQTLAQRVLTPPTGSLSLNPAQPNEGQSVAFSAPGSDADGGSVIWRTWQWGDGTASVAGTSVTQNHTFRDSNPYTVTVTLVDDEEQTTAVSQTVTPTNLPPAVNVFGDRRWVSGQRLLFGTSVSDPGALDTITCRWDYGDAPAAPAFCYNFDHTYILPQGSERRTFTATLEATDDEGARGSDSLDVTVFPQLFRDVGAASQPALVGVGWSPLVNELVIAWNQTCATRVSLMGLDGQIRPVSPQIARACAETDIAVSPGAGGFGLGDVFLSNGLGGQLARVRMDATGAFLGADNPWVTISGVSARLAGMAFDTQGAFGGDLIAVFTDGQVFRVRADRTATRVAHLARLVEGADVAPALGFGPASGCVLTTDAGGKTVLAVCPNGAISTVMTISGASGALESLSAVPSAGDLFLTDPDRGRVYRGDSRFFTGALTGHVLVATVTNGEIWNLFYDPATNSYKTDLFTLAMRESSTIRIEQTAFVSVLVSGSTTLAPAQATLPVGDSHTVTATVRDASGQPMQGIELTFTVTGANPTTGTAVTNASGEARFSYAGVSTGTDTIVAGVGGANSRPATAVWVRRTTAVAANPVLARIDAEPAVFGALSASLTGAGGAPVGGRTIGFYVTDPVSGARSLQCSSTTDDNGLAACTDPAAVAAAIIAGGYEAVFDGDPTYEGSADKAGLVFVDRDVP